MNSSDSTNKRSRQENDNVDNDIDEEVQKLFRKNNGKFSPHDLLKIRAKYDDEEMADKVLHALSKKHKSISKKAKKFAQLIRERYSNQQYPFHVLLEKARLFKVKHGLTDEEFNEFQRIYELELVGRKSSEVIIPATNMTKLLGSVTVDYQGFNNKLNDNDYKLLQEIIALHAATRPLHAQVVLQSIQYEDCAFEAVMGEYDPKFGNRPGDSVHPVIAALFLPKIKILDDHFLLSNMFNIVKSRYNDEALTTRPDYELFYALTTDPNDVVCDSRSSMSDLLNRCRVQQQLWNNVLNLRNGQYYNSNFREFISSIDMCKLNKQDNPDLVYGRYDGTILKRLITSFSFRPSIVSTTSVYTIQNMNPYQQNVRPVVTSIPMINLRLPPVLNEGDDEPVQLRDALEQHQFFIENGVMVPRHTSLIYSKGVLFFFVDRRANVIKYETSTPFNISALPVAMLGFDYLNNRQVDYEESFILRGDTYNLRSVVLAEVSNTQPHLRSQIVLGSSTVIMVHADINKGLYQNEYLHYNPLSAGLPYTDPFAPDGPLEPTPPITMISDNLIVGDNTFRNMAQSRGTIFMYELVNDKTNGQLMY
jgi:hypothetical protein